MPAPTHALQPQDDRDLAAVHGHAPPEEDQVSALLMTLGPDDYENLASLLRSHPQLREQIIQQATQLVGSHCVGQALALLAVEEHRGAQVKGPPPTAADQADNLAMLADVNGLDPKTGQPQAAEPEHVKGPAPSQADQADNLAMLADVNGLDPKTGEPLAGEPVKGPAPNAADQADNLAMLAQVNGLDPKTGEPLPTAPVSNLVSVPTKEQQDDNLAMLAEVNGIDPNAVPAAPTAEPEKEADWVTRARAYNTSHHGLAQRFDELTSGACSTDGELDPRKVSDWQAAHGVPPDGRVGPATVRAAERLGEAKAHDPEDAAHAEGADGPDELA